MDKIEQDLCDCDFVIGITYCDNFVSLDQSFVEAVMTVIGSTFAALYIGTIDESEVERLLLAEASKRSDSLPDVAAFKEKDFDQDDYELIPITLDAGRQLVLVVRCDYDERKLEKLSQLLTVYKNQHGHLTRSNRDKLTNLKNRRAFDIEYQLLTDAPPNLQGCYFLGVLDIDFFKLVNDNYGHLIGDETLVAVSNLMKEYFVREDNLYRFGGEEFVILFSASSVAHAKDVLDGLRIKISNYSFPQVGKKTVSIGYIQLATGVRNDLLFERADAALYYAKSSGRNCVKNYEALVDQRLIEPIQSREGPIELF